MSMVGKKIFICSLLLWLTPNLAQTAPSHDEALTQCTQNISQNYDFSESEASKWCAFDSSNEFQACAKTLKDKYGLSGWESVIRCASNNMEEMLGCIQQRLGDSDGKFNSQSYYAVIHSGMKIYEPGSPHARARHFGKNTGKCSPYED